MSRTRALRRRLLILCYCAVIATIVSLDGCSSSDPANGNSEADTAEPQDTDPAVTPTYSFEIVNVFPHDASAFTQGLVYLDGFLYESTGQYGRSVLRKVELRTGQVVQEISLPSQYWGEGMAIFNDRIIQLTYRSNVGFVYGVDSFEELGRVTYPTEGWGLTWDGERLIMTDGSSTLFFRDPDTFEEIGRVDVHHSGDRLLDDLNELEFVNGEVFANVWQTDLIARISPQTGEVVGWIDLRGLLTSSERNQSNFLNGIAYDEANDRLFVTGKLWPWMFEIDLTAPE